MVLSQFMGVLAIILWAGGIAFIIFYILKTRNLLRLPLAVEMAGCDVLKHGEPAYPSEAWKEFQYRLEVFLPTWGQEWIFHLMFRHSRDPLVDR